MKARKIAQLAHFVGLSCFVSYAEKNEKASCNGSNRQKSPNSMRSNKSKMPPVLLATKKEHVYLTLNPALKLFKL